MADRGQLSLFGVDAAGPEAVVTDAQRALAARLPAGLRLGTSSWTFPGWAGIVYAGRPSKERLVHEGLAAYAKHPLLRTVGVDRSFYGPLTAEEWQAYAAQLPAGFRAVAKAFSDVTTVVFADHPRLGERAGRVNPHFLDAALARELVVAPYLRGLGERAGPLVFELSPIPDRLVPDEDAFLRRLDDFLGALPRELDAAIELRTRRLLTPRYLEVLRARGCAHVLNYWTAMPTLREQLALAADLPGRSVVVRLMLPPGTSYEALKQAYAPFDRLHAPQEAMRADVLEIVRSAIARGREVFVIANNKAEGSSPLTLFALAERIAAAP